MKQIPTVSWNICRRETEMDYKEKLQHTKTKAEWEEGGGGGQGKEVV